MDPTDDHTLLSRTAAQTAVESTGWRLMLGALCLSVPVTSLSQGCAVAALATVAAADRADEHLRADVRPDRVELSLQTRSRAGVTPVDVALAGVVSQALAQAGHTVLSPTTAAAGTSARPAATGRPVEMLEIAIDALDIAAVRPFWKAALAYTDEPGHDGPTDPLVDPAGQLPALWFQQMDVERPQRNRIHLDVTVAHDEAPSRVEAVLAAGGRLLDDTFARSFWVLADAEGNEVCICTWLDRDEREAAGEAV